jgi:long-subunit fatty acid transport protein
MLNDYELPSSYRFAFQFKPRNILKTTFNVETELVRWSETNKLFEDQFNYYLGIEHKIIETVPVRLGFSSTRSYDLAFEHYTEELEDENGQAYTQEGNYTYAVKLMTPSVALGTGFEFSKSFRADLGFTYSFRKYENLDLFMDEYYDHDFLWPTNTDTNSYNDILLQNRNWSNPDSVKENIFDFMFSLTLDI